MVRNPDSLVTIESLKALLKISDEGPDDCRLIYAVGARVSRTSVAESPQAGSCGRPMMAHDAASRFRAHGPSLQIKSLRREPSTTQTVVITDL